MPLLFSVTVGIVGVAQAAPVTWDLEDVTFADGGVATGSFVFDASDNTFLSWSVTTTGTLYPYEDGAYGLPGNTYTTNNLTTADTNFYSNPRGAEFEAGDGSADIALTLASALTDAGGTVKIAFFSERDGFNTRITSAGSLVSEVPLPATIMLFGSALLGMIIVVRANRNASARINRTRLFFAAYSLDSDRRHRRLWRPISHC